MHICVFRIPAFSEWTETLHSVNMHLSMNLLGLGINWMDFNSRSELILFTVRFPNIMLSSCRDVYYLLSACLCLWWDRVVVVVYTLCILYNTKFVVLNFSLLPCTWKNTWDNRHQTREERSYTYLNLETARLVLWFSSVAGHGVWLYGS